MSCSELKMKSREQLRGNWGIAIGTVLLASIFLNTDIAYRVTTLLGMDGLSFSIDLISLLLGGVISVGLCKFLLNMATRTDEPRVKDLFSQFNIYLKTLGLYILVTLAILIGLILLIVPGIIVALMFSQSYFILAEDNSKSITECIRESIDMMKGHKGELFYLELSFIGWWLLTVITFGIAGLWVAPYQKLTEANFYLSIK